MRSSQKAVKALPASRSSGVPYRRVLIVGLGLIGGSLALALRRSGFLGSLVGVSRPESLGEGKRLGAIDEGFDYTELARAAVGAELIILATPIEKIREHVKILGKAALKAGTIVTDVGSTKVEILEAARRFLPKNVHFIGGHPMAGSEKQGMAAADPFLFQNAYYILTPSPTVPESEVTRLGEFVGRTGARVLVLEAGEHDRVAAAISHVPQLLAVALVNSLDGLGPLREIAVRLAAGGFRDMTRIASSPFTVWRDILASNSGEIGASLDRLRALVEQALERVRLGEKGLPSIEATFDHAAATRSMIPRDTKGFLRPLADVLVVVEDRPGVIAKVSAALAGKGINIQDIEVLKVRIGEGGSLRLGFATHALAEEAVRVLAAHEFTARVRE